MLTPHLLLADWCRPMDKALPLGLRLSAPLPSNSLFLGRPSRPMGRREPQTVSTMSASLALSSMVGLTRRRPWQRPIGREHETVRHRRAPLLLWGTVE